MNSASAMALLERLPCLKLLNETTGPCARRTLSLTVLMVGCSIVLSHVALVRSFKNYIFKNKENVLSYVGNP